MTLQSVTNSIRSPYTKGIGLSRKRNTQFNLLFVFVPFKTNGLESLSRGSSFSTKTGLTARTDILECAQDGQRLFPILGTYLKRTFLQFLFCFGKSRNHIGPLQAILGNHSLVLWRSEITAASSRR